MRVGFAGGLRAGFAGGLRAGFAGGLRASFGPLAGFAGGLRPASGPAANRTRTAEARPPWAGGWASGLISILLAASARSRNQPGTGGPGRLPAVLGVTAHENGPDLTSLAAITGSVGPSP